MCEKMGVEKTRNWEVDREETVQSANTYLSEQR